MKKNVHIGVYIEFPSATKKSDVENILRSLGYNITKNEKFISEKHCNFTKDIKLNLEDIDRYLEKSELEIKNTLEKCDIKTTKILFMSEYEN